VKTKLILSVHDFEKVPSDLARKMHAMMDDSACSIVKVAARARNVLDAAELLEMCRHSTKPAIMLGMGEFGSMSRVLAGKFGAFLTFAPLSREAATAPGQFSLRELTGTFGIRRVRSSSRVYAIVGWPVSASLSPAVHNAAFARRSDDDRIYVHAPIAAHATANDDDAHAAEAGFVATMLELIEQEHLQFSGASVTMPHKASLAKLAVAKGWGRDDAVLATGAANTLVIEGEGPQKRIRVLNTDAGALLHMLQTLAESRHDHNRKSMQEMSVAIVGAGGVAAAAAWAAAKVGAKVTIFNRTRARAEALRTTLERAIPTAQIASSELHELASVDCDVMVQCTSVGMQHAESAVPREVFTRLTGPRTFIETIYRPIKTAALLAAKHAGWHVIDGTQLFVKQAELQSAAWLGEMPPDGLFTNIVHNALSSET
jgi:3-dehydroquinate dehydratase/shikimate dehydrogenase